MAPNKIRRALGAVKDKTSIGLAKVSSSNTLSELEVAIVKATRHEELPAEERHIREILSLTSYSQTYISACVNTLSRRLNKTKNWTVALKTLMLIHRLLLEGHPAYESEIFYATRRGTRLLNMSDFRDSSRRDSWDFSAFVRTFALYLEERLEFQMQGRRGGLPCDLLRYDEDEEETARSPVKSNTPVHELKSIERIFTRCQHLQRILERFLACRPTGEPKHNRVVIVAFFPTIKESFQIYYDITEIMGILIDRFMDLDVHDCVRVHDIFSRLSKQFDELDSIYSWCKQIGLGRSSEYPEVDRITPKKLEVMDEFIRDKSVLAQRMRANNRSEQRSDNSPIIQEKKDDKERIHIEEENMSKIKSLPSSEGFSKEKKKEDSTHTTTTTTTTSQQEADLLNLHDNDTMTTEECGDKLALALFNGVPTSSAAASQTPGWEAFMSDDSGDWETALVQSASNLSNQKTSLGGGFDTLLLDGMYQQSAVVAAQRAYVDTGSASSIVMSDKPAMLALPAPPVSANGGVNHNVDPFAASLTVAPPSYVQMSDLEKKQKLLMEEHMMWQQYTRDGMQGQVGLMQLQQNQYYPHNTGGGYTRSY